MPDGRQDGSLEHLLGFEVVEPKPASRGVDDAPMTIKQAAPDDFLSLRLEPPEEAPARGRPFRRFA